MKLILLLACLALMLIHNEAQFCRGRVRPSERNCVGGKDSGTRRANHCHRTANDHMWYYSNRTRSCRRMSYHGCGGNKNRYCSLASCEKKCVQPREIDTTITKPNNPTTTELINTNLDAFDNPTLAGVDNATLAEFGNPNLAEFDNTTQVEPAGQAAPLAKFGIF
ncbi:uncharacterized protein LOC132791717 [Drosophila nasuta]|uniref:uncharacterized protein LOC132791717 n=1 Tax=Drosophila nasuta TaxID=42062 RepID=UPI00295E2CAB|nr:uncharacterized protein LOC132791717 [Drosophila nasuta]